MKVLSIDVGIKNLAYCLFDLNTLTNSYEIVLWNVINLCGDEPNCTADLCKQKAKYVNDKSTLCLCLKHAKKSTYILPTADLSIKKIKKMSKEKLSELVRKHIILLKHSDAKKEDILKTVLEFFNEKMLQSSATSSANDLNLIQIGVAMKKAFDIEFVNHITSIEQIVIENQISPIANRMKSLQGMIAQYFIMHDITKIDFVSASNKLKVGDTPKPPSETNTSGAIPSPSSYAFRKKEGIRVTLQLLEKDEKHKKWLAHFKTHKKKDDLADAFLQGNWFLFKK
jgi:hypothetical protein